MQQQKNQQFKSRNNFYEQLPPNIIVAFKMCNLVHIYLIGLYVKSIRQQKPGKAIIKKGVSLTCMKMIGPTTVWFKNFEVPCFDLNEVARRNSSHIEKSSTRLIHIFNNTWLCRYPLPREVVFDKIYDFN